MAATAGLAAAVLHSGIPDTPRWRLWWICLLLALWPPSDPSYWETSVSDWPRPNMLPCSHTHRVKHTLPVASAACHTINTSCPFFMATNTFHMLLASSKIILNFRGHNKSARLLVLGSEKPQDARPAIFVNMICDTFQTAGQTAAGSCTVCGWRRSQIPPVPRLMVPFYCVCQNTPAGCVVNASQLQLIVKITARSEVFALDTSTNR